jgi:hypothetical protein
VFGSRDGGEHWALLGRVGNRTDSVVMAILADSRNSRRSTQRHGRSTRAAVESSAARIVGARGGWPGSAGNRSAPSRRLRAALRS